METMTNQNGRRGNVTLFQLALAVLAGFQPGLAETPDWRSAPIEQTRRAAEEGNPEAQLTLGDAYRRGGLDVAKDHPAAVRWYVTKDYSEAVRWYRKAAEQGSKRAQVNLGMMYYFGKDVPPDPRKAIKWLRMAAEQEAYLYPPVFAFSDAFIENVLASLYKSGEGVQDYREALKWYRKAAARGYAPAQRVLGDMYYRGKGVPQHYREALKWFSLAAEQGDALAQILLGEMYAIGRGVPTDYIHAYAWLSLAAIEEDTAGREARRMRDRVLAEMSSEQLSSAQNLSAELHQRIETSKSK